MKKGLSVNRHFRQIPPPLDPGNGMLQGSSYGQERSLSSGCTNVRMSKVILFLICSAVSASAGLSKLDAIAMIETGNNDEVIGSAGEVSRYQIKPRIWREYSPSRAWRNAEVSTQ